MNTSSPALSHRCLHLTVSFYSSPTVAPHVSTWHAWDHVSKHRCQEMADEEIFNWSGIQNYIPRQVKPVACHIGLYNTLSRALNKRHMVYDCLLQLFLSCSLLMFLLDSVCISCSAYINIANTKIPRSPPSPFEFKGNAK